MRDLLKRYGASALIPAAALGLGLIGGGCDLFEDPVVQPPPPAATQPPPAQQPAQQPAAAADGEEATDGTYKRREFASGKRRDPFHFIPPEPEVKQEQAARVKAPLENFDVGQLRLVAIVTGTAVPTAMFIDSTGFGHFAKEDDRIGRDGGRITDIRDNEVEITINPEGAVSTAGDIEDVEDDERPPTEPVTLVIRLSDTEIRLPESEEDEVEKILDKIEETPEDTTPKSPLAP